MVYNPDLILDLNYYEKNLPTGYDINLAENHRVLKIHPASKDKLMMLDEVIMAELSSCYFKVFDVNEGVYSSKEFEIHS